MKNDPALDALQKAAKGLLYISETEAELEPFLWQSSGELTRETVLLQAGAEAGTTVEEATLDSFFRTVSKEDKPKFDKLSRVLKEQLSSIKVYRLGDEAEKEVYIVGKTKSGQWAGIKTSVVET